MVRIQHLSMASGLAIALVTGAAGTAHAAFIAGQDDNGDVFRIDVTDGSIDPTPILTNTNVTTDGSAPNALGFDATTGDFYRTNLGQNGDPELFRNNTGFVDLDTVGNEFAGGAVDGVYYGVSQGGNYFEVDLTTGTISEPFELGTFVSLLGDLVVRGNSMFVSAAQGFFEFDLTDGSVLSSNEADTLPKYAGLAFSGGTLFGIETDSNAVNATQDTLYEVSLASGTFGEGTTIAALDSSFAFNDAAAVPLPAAAWLFLSGLAGVFGWARRSKSAGAAAAA